MADSIFRQLFDHAMDVLEGRLSDDPVGVTITFIATGNTLDVQGVFNEQVGFVDDQRRAVFLFDADTIAASPDGQIRRGDYFVLTAPGEVDRWYAVDIRDDKAGGIEVRADGTLERL